MHLQDITIYADDATSLSFEGKQASSEIIEHMIRTLDRTGDTIHGIDAKDMNGRNVSWRVGREYWNSGDIIWKNGPGIESLQELKEDIVAGRRVLVSENGLGYGVAEGLVEDGDDFKIRVAFMTNSGVEINSDVPLEMAQFLPQEIILKAVNENTGQVMEFEVTSSVLEYSDEEIMKFITDYEFKSPLSEEDLNNKFSYIHDLLDEDQVKEIIGCDIEIVDSIAEYFGGKAVYDSVEEVRRVPESIFRKNLENTNQCRLLENIKPTLENGPQMSA